MKGFRNVRAYVRGKGIIQCDIGVENGRIAFVGTDEKIESEISTLAGGVLCPGFLDQHIHGACGYDAMDGSAEAFQRISSALAAEGTTAFLGTTMTAPLSEIRKVERAAALAQKEVTGATLLGLHLEGPFLSPHYMGAQNASFSAGCDEAFYTSELVKLVTIAPELDGADELIRKLTARGIHVSAGHSGASGAQMKKATALGLDGVTHTYNAMSALHHREIGLVGSALLLDTLFCEVIADGLHVCDDALRLLFQNKPKDKVILITDAMRGKGMEDGEYDLGGQSVRLTGGEARLSDGTLAGSSLKMNEAVRNVVRLGVSFENAVDFASYNPALHLGLADDRGSIAEGKRADFVMLSDNFEVLFTVVNGKIVYQKDRL